MTASAGDLRETERERLRSLVAPDMEGRPRWHTDHYELRARRWQAVWSQATRITWS
jgi:hypothetical protein